jgi:hypothetical protein
LDDTGQVNVANGNCADSEQSWVVDQAEHTAEFADELEAEGLLGGNALATPICTSGSDDLDCTAGCLYVFLSPFTRVCHLYIYRLYFHHSSCHQPCSPSQTAQRYNIKDDPSERNNLILLYPELAATLQARIITLQRGTNGFQEVRRDPEGWCRQTVVQGNRTGYMEPFYEHTNFYVRCSLCAAIV